MKQILSCACLVVIATAATVLFAAGGGALCRAEGAAQNSATTLLSGGNPDPTVCRDELIAGDWTDPAATRYSLLDRPDDPARYIKVRDLAGRVDYPDIPFRFCAALAATPPRRATVVAPLSIHLRVADEQKSAGMRETLSLDGESLSELRL